MAITQLSRYRIIQGLVVCVLIVGVYFHSSAIGLSSRPALEVPYNSFPSCFADDEQHPIDQLVCDANNKFDNLLSKATTGVSNTAHAYRERRGRHPPPGFDKWVEFAASKNALMIEDLFDQIYHDLDPFWGLSPHYIRLFSRSFNSVISIRNGNLTRWKTIVPQLRDSVATWLDMIAHIPSENLPDVDMAFNLLDEPHLFLAWEDVNMHMNAARSTKHTRPSTMLQPIITEYSKYPPVPEDFDPEGHVFPEANKEDTIWGHAQKACPPGSAARSYPQDADMTTPANFPTGSENHFHRGFISNWTSAQNACDNPYIGDMHGTYISMQVIDEFNPTVVKNGYIWNQLVPIFSYCKINGVNQDILIPGVVYWPMNDKGEEGFSIDNKSHVPWDTKQDHFTWYGSASGGWNNESTWTRFPRHRLVSMMNGTQVAATELDLETHSHQPPSHVPGSYPLLPFNFPFPSSKIYDLAALKSAPTRLGSWILSLTRAFIVDLRCYPPWFYINDNSASCPYSGQFYDVVKPVSHTEHFKSKYLPDLDGASFSGRYLSLLASESVPVKATIYSEWHDSRLIPWRHFVPMDNSFVDLWGIIEYFLGYRDEKGTVVKEAHDDAGRELGQKGSDWVKVALRKEDMVVYMYRLILEFARISDDSRVDMGYVDDLL